MPFITKQWFVFDRRTRTIRPSDKRDFAISNQRGQRFRVNKAAVVRKWIGEAEQRIAYYGGSVRNLRNVPGQCLDVHGGHNHHHRWAIFWPCHDGANQGWLIDREGVNFPRYPLRDGEKFQIKTQMKSKRAVKWDDAYGSAQFRLRIYDTNPYDERQWFTFDWRTKTIRTAANAKFVVSIQRGANNWAHKGYAAVVRQYKGEAQQKMRWYESKTKTIRDVYTRCLDVHGGHDH